jgi:hypothetical protein
MSGSDRDDAEQMAFSAGIALAEAYIRSVGGDPKKPTKKQAKAAARFILNVVCDSYASGVAAMSEAERKVEVAEIVATHQRITRARN